ncbi:peptidylprolyl isomerase, partial [Escherichia coli]|nr:peptidylprolyl isomerase [Escherichia coli]
VTEGIKVLQCGDPSATGDGWRDTDGTGGPSYRMAEENLPTDKRPPYPAGVIAMANSGQPSSSGSQFFIVYGDSPLDPNYTVLGTIT